MRLISRLFLVAAIFLSSIVISPQQAKAMTSASCNDSFIRVGYINFHEGANSWEDYEQLFDCSYTHIVLTFYHPVLDGSGNPTGALIAKDAVNDFRNFSDADKLIRRAHDAGVKVLFSLGGSEVSYNTYDKIATKPAVKQIFLNNITALLNQNELDAAGQATGRKRFDGIDLNWESWQDLNPQSLTDAQTQATVNQKIANVDQLALDLATAVKAQNSSSLVSVIVAPLFYLPYSFSSNVVNSSNVDYVHHAAYTFAFPNQNYPGAPWRGRGTDLEFMLPNLDSASRIERSIYGAYKYMKDIKGYNLSKIIGGIPYFATDIGFNNTPGDNSPYFFLKSQFNFDSLPLDYVYLEKKVNDFYVNDRESIKSKIFIYKNLRKFAPEFSASLKGLKLFDVGDEGPQKASIPNQDLLTPTMFAAATSTPLTLPSGPVPFLKFSYINVSFDFKKWSEYTQLFDKSFDFLISTFMIPDSAGNLTGVDAAGGPFNPFTNADILRAQAAGTKVVPSIGGATVSHNVFRDIANNPSARTNFLNQLVTLLNNSPYDGLDINIEGWENIPTGNVGGQASSEAAFFTGAGGAEIAAVADLAKEISMLSKGHGASKGKFNFNSAAIAPLNFIPFSLPSELINDDSLIDYAHQESYDFFRGLGSDFPNGPFRSKLGVGFQLPNGRQGQFLVAPFNFSPIERSVYGALDYLASSRTVNIGNGQTKVLPGYNLKKIALAIPFFATKNNGTAYHDIRTEVQSSSKTIDPDYLETRVIPAVGAPYYVSDPSTIPLKVNKYFNIKDVDPNDSIITDLAGLMIWQLGHAGANRDLSDAVVNAVNANAPVPTPVNNAPVLTTIGSQNLNQGIFFSKQISATDPDGDTVTISDNGTLPPGLAITNIQKNGNTTTALIEGIPSSSGTVNTRITVSDNNGGLDFEDLNFNITPTPNAAPTVIIDNASLTEGQAGTINFNALDGDADTMTVRLQNPPAGAVIDQASLQSAPGQILGLINFTPTSSGTVTLTLCASDTKDETCEPKTFTVDPAPTTPPPPPIPTNLPPEFKNFPSSQNLIAGLAYTSPDFVLEDPEGDRVNIQFINIPAGLKELTVEDNLVQGRQIKRLQGTPVNSSGNIPQNFTLLACPTDFQTHAVAIECSRLSMTVGFPSNQAPIFDPISPLTFTIDQSGLLNVSATDADNDDIDIFISSSLPADVVVTKTITEDLPGSEKVEFEFKSGSAQQFNVEVCHASLGFPNICETVSVTANAVPAPNPTPNPSPAPAPNPTPSPAPSTPTSPLPQQPSVPTINTTVTPSFDFTEIIGSTDGTIASASLAKKKRKLNFLIKKDSSLAGAKLKLKFSVPDKYKGLVKIKKARSVSKRVNKNKNQTKGVKVKVRLAKRAKFLRRFGLNTVNAGIEIPVRIQDLNTGYTKVAKIKLN